MSKKSQRRTVSQSAALLVLFAVISPGQSITTAAGGLLHHTEGRVLVGGLEFQFDPSRLLHLTPGERVRAEDGRAEIMLVPDGFLRLARESEAEMVTVGIDSAQARLLRGSAIVELNDLWDKESVSLLAGVTVVRFRKPGLYRIDARENEPVRVKILRGKATVEANGMDRDVKGKRCVTLSASGDPVSAKLDQSEKDSLDKWSEQRQQILAKARREAEADAPMARRGPDLRRSSITRCRQLGICYDPSGSGQAPGR